MEKVQQSLTKERKKTDESLTIERGKTDESFSRGRGYTHESTDEIVLKDRAAADQDRLLQRNAADSTCNATKALNSQRKSEDSAIESERSNMDAALRRERGEKERLMNKTVSQEREATDKNLKGERVKIDNEVERVAVLLNDEHAAHVETQSALTTREEFVAIVSHDLRNPIGAILTSIEILSDDTSLNTISTDAKKLFELIKRNAEISLRLINDILDMERIVDGKIQLQFSLNNIDNLIQETVENFAYSALAKKITLKISPSNIRQAISCDKDRIAQILSNLIGNALKFTPVGGSVTVAAHPSQTEITFSVHDSGPGIPDDQKSRIFERFAQIGNKQRGGLGLGLYISKTLVESHLGKIWVTSEPGNGSTFQFTLPL